MKTFRKICMAILFLLLAPVFLAGCSSSKAASSEQTQNLVISHFLPGNHPVQTDLFKEFGDRLQSLSNGRLSYALYPSNALGAANSQYDMAVTGEADISLSVHGYTNGRFPLVTVMELPYLTESAEHGSAILSHLLEEFPALKEEHGDTVPLWLFTADPAQIVSKSHRIEHPEDLEGLKVRSPSPMGNEILEQLGAVPISMPMGDVYEAMERGVIDAAMIPLEALYAYNLHEVSNYITMGNFSSTPFFAVMNKNTFNKLTESEQEGVKQLMGKEYAVKSGRLWDASSKKGRQLAEERGAEFIELDHESEAEWKEALEPIVENWIKDREEQGYPARDIYERAIELSEELKQK